ncbi:MAG: sulfatase [Verrucomicrobiota bacterium]
MKSILAAVVSFLALPGTLLNSEESSPEKRMNVLWLMIDDLNTWLLEDPDRYTGKVVAPNLQKLAGTGVNFVHAYTASPVCSPSRTALFSGVSPWKSGVYHNGLDMEPSEALNAAIPMPKQFRDAGYYLASFGKIGHGWDFRKSFDLYVPHKRDPPPPGSPLTTVGRGEQDWGPTHLDENEMGDTRYADGAIEQLRMKHEKPFFIACGLFHPHMPWYVPQKYFDLFPLDEVEIPPLLETDLDDIPEPGRDLIRGKQRFVDSVREAGLHREAVQAYLATTAYADAQMGRVLDVLEESPYHDNTIVVLMSDHGFHLGEKNHWQKATLWEEATHCLLMFRVPGMTGESQVCERFVSLQDLYPTMMELCGLENPDYVDGRSLAPLLKDPQAEWESTAISALGDQHLSIRTEGFRYIRYAEGVEEFYDRTADVNEWVNGIENQDYASEVERHRTLLPAFSDMREPLVRKR